MTTNTKQLTFIGPDSRHEEMRQQVIAFNEEHPEVMRLFSKFTFEQIAKGFKHYSATGVFERIRWETDKADSKGGSTFKLNNNYMPFYARAWMKMHPEHDGFFRTRKQLSEDEPATNKTPLTPAYFDKQ